MRALLPPTLRSSPHPLWNYRCAQEICPLRTTRIIPWCSLKLMAGDGNQPCIHQGRPLRVRNAPTSELIACRYAANFADEATNCVCKKERWALASSGRLLSCELVHRADWS